MDPAETERGALAYVRRGILELHALENRNPAFPRICSGITRRIYEKEVTVAEVMDVLLELKHFAASSHEQFAQNARVLIYAETWGLTDLFFVEKRVNRESGPRGNTVIRKLFEKALDEEEGTHQGEAIQRRRNFCEHIIVRIGVDWVLAPVEICVDKMADTTDEKERALAKKLLCKIVEEEGSVERALSARVPSLELCGMLNRKLYEPCSEEFTDAAIEIVALIAAKTRSAPRLVTGVVRSLSNRDEQQRGIDLLVRFSERFGNFFWVSNTLSQALKDPSARTSAIEAYTRILSKPKKSPYHTENFRRKVFDSIVDIIGEEEIKTAYVEIAFSADATSHALRALTDRLWHRTKSRPQAEEVIWQILERDHRLASFQAKKCLGMYEFAGSKPDRALESTSDGSVLMMVGMLSKDEIREMAMAGIEEIMERTDDTERTDDLNTAAMQNAIQPFFVSVVERLPPEHADYALRKMLANLANEKRIEIAAKCIDSAMKGKAGNALVDMLAGIIFYEEAKAETTPGSTSGLRDAVCEYLGQRKEVRDVIYDYFVSVVERLPPEHAGDVLRKMMTNLADEKLIDIMTRCLDSAIDGRSGGVLADLFADVLFGNGIEMEPGVRDAIYDYLGKRMKVRDAIKERLMEKSRTDSTIATMLEPHRVSTYPVRRVIAQGLLLRMEHEGTNEHMARIACETRGTVATGKRANGARTTT